MTEQRPERPIAEDGATAAEWATFLEARVKEELEAAGALAQHGWWELTEPGARRFGVQGMGGRVFAPILTGSGHFLDQATAMHIVRNQPQRTRDDLLGKLMLVNLLKIQAAEDGAPLVGPLLMIVRQFSDPFIDHPQHPEYVASEGP
ncbi:DUF6221 family protein [Streptomyces sp. NPDC056099]|uniref:DUF6221 family protein n=1 Tax=unclassified Streptomyces TaxID=2593676 RepID=UPI0035E2C3BE